GARSGVHRLWPVFGSALSAFDASIRASCRFAVASERVGTETAIASTSTRRRANRPPCTSTSGCPLGPQRVLATPAHLSVPCQPASLVPGLALDAVGKDRH